MATISAIAAYAEVLFWVRALQVLLLLFAAPMLIALGTPMTVFRSVLDGAARTRFDRLLATRTARVVAHHSPRPSPCSARRGCFTSRPGTPPHSNADRSVPVPVRYSQLLSMVISIVETVGDGLLGVVLWLGPLLAMDYYRTLSRDWGPSPRVDQSIGAGVLWILGDVLGLPFLMLLVRALSVDEKARAADVDAELDPAPDVPPERLAESTLWWKNDPQLPDRFS